jgi:hypothetical protein
MLDEGNAMAYLTAMLSILLAAASSGLAAHYWFRVFLVEAPAVLLAPRSGSAADLGEPVSAVDTRRLVEFVKETGQRNKVAAAWSSIAAFLLFASALAWWVAGISMGPPAIF